MKRNGRTTTLALMTANDIESMIISEGMRPGDRLPKMADLEEKFEVSHSIMREALRMLETRGLLQIQHGIGSVVASPSIATNALSASLGSVFRMRLSSWMHLLEFRRVLEPAIAEMAAERRTDEDLAAIESALAASRGSPISKDIYVKADINFHNALVDATHNPVIASVMHSIQAQMEKSREITFRGPEEGVSRALHNHQKIFERVKAQDPEGARKAMIRHLEQTKEDLELAIQQGRIDTML